MGGNGMDELLGLSASLLAGRTARFPQLLPGPGQRNLLNTKTWAFSIQENVHPLSWQACKSSFGFKNVLEVTIRLYRIQEGSRRLYEYK